MCTVSNSADNPQLKRVTTNSALLFIRVMMLAFINLYAVRLVINSLGKSDYGLYNALTGVVMLSIIFVTLFALPIQRFYSYAIGKEAREFQSVIFSSSINLLGLLGGLLFLLFETFGVYFVLNDMTIPIERTWAAVITFRIAIVTFLFSLFQIPFLAMILANEDMSIYALVSCIDSIIKLISAFLITYAPFDPLVFYAVCLLVTAGITFFSYAIICHLKYKECRYCKVKDKSIYTKLIKFVGWTSLGSLSGVGLIQGSIILLNVFFGPLANAAFGVANNVYNAIMSLGNSIIVAFRPATIKSYVANNMCTLDKLFSLGNKFLLYLLLSISIPLIYEMDQVLQWWLGYTDIQTIIFCRLFVIYGIFISMGAPISNIVQASGKLKTYYLSSEMILLIHLPFTWILFKLEMPAYYVLVSMILFCAISHIIRVMLLKRYYPHFSQRNYYISLFVPAIIIAIIGVIISEFLRTVIISRPMCTFAIVIIVPIVVLTLATIFGSNIEERRSMVQFIKNTVKKKCRTL